MTTPTVLFTTYLIHIEEDPQSIVVGSDRSLQMAVTKAKQKSGIHYIYKWSVVDDPDQTLMNPTLETTVSR